MKRPAFFSRFLWSLSIVSLLCTLSLADEPINPIGVHAFESTLFPVLRQKCSQCHGDGATAIGHSVSDVTKAYQAARLFVNFSNLEYSEFIDRVKSRHWKEYDTNAQGMPVEEMRQLLRNWWTAGESDVVPQYDLISTAVRLPYPLPTMAQGQFKRVEWGNFDPPYSNCAASVEIQSVVYGPEQKIVAYRVRNPRFGCLDKTVLVQGVYFSVSGDLAPYENIYKSVDKTISTVEFNSGTALSSELMILEPRLDPSAQAETLRLMIKRLSTVQP